MRQLAINAIEWKDTEKYMQTTSLKIKFITWIIGYKEKQIWNKPAGLPIF